MPGRVVGQRNIRVAAQRTGAEHHAGHAESCRGHEVSGVVVGGIALSSNMLPALPNAMVQSAAMGPL